MTDFPSSGFGDAQQGAEPPHLHGVHNEESCELVGNQLPLPSIPMSEEPNGLPHLLSAVLRYWLTRPLPPTKHQSFTFYSKLPARTR